MGFDPSDLESYVYEILSTRKKDFFKSQKMFLEGFDGIVGGVMLDTERLETCIDTLMSNHPKFTKIVDAGFTERFKQTIDEGVLASKYVSVNDYFHLSFWIWKYFPNTDSETCVLYCSPINQEPILDINVTHKKSGKIQKYRPVAKRLPLIDLRYSGVYDEEIPMAAEFEGITYNVLDAFSNISDPHVLMDSYNRINYLIDYSRIENMSKVNKLL